MNIWLVNSEQITCSVANGMHTCRCKLKLAANICEWSFLLFTDNGPASANINISTKKSPENIKNTSFRCQMHVNKKLKTALNARFSWKIWHIKSNREPNARNEFDLSKISSFSDCCVVCVYLKVLCFTFLPFLCICLTQT